MIIPVIYVCSHSDHRGKYSCQDHLMISAICQTLVCVMWRSFNYICYKSEGDEGDLSMIYSQTTHAI
jgi:hypothetical protein